jgi:hypothetical protein
MKRFHMVTFILVLTYVVWMVFMIIMTAVTRFNAN